MDIQEQEQEQEIPKHLKCPINLTLMVEPVITNNGHTYERDAIETWMENNSNDPLTRELIWSICPNRAIKDACDEYRKSQNQKSNDSEMVEMDDANSATSTNLEEELNLSSNEDISTQTEMDGGISATSTDLEEELNLSSNEDNSTQTETVMNYFLNRICEICDKCHNWIVNFTIPEWIFTIPKRALELSNSALIVLVEIGKLFIMFMATLFLPLEKLVILCLKNYYEVQLLMIKKELKGTKTLAEYNKIDDLKIAYTSKKKRFDRVSRKIDSSWRFLSTKWDNNEHVRYYNFNHKYFTIVIFGLLPIAIVNLPITFVISIFSISLKKEKKRKKRKKKRKLKVSPFFLLI